MKATAQAHSNIAFIKYWGNADEALRLPANPSISMNLAGVETVTTVEWREDLGQDTLMINDAPADAKATERVARHLDAVRARLGVVLKANVSSRNNFPMGAGIASSASSFAALTVAAVSAAGGQLSERELSCIARLGSGSASRSIPGGYVEWQTGETHEESFAFQVAPEAHWDLVDVVAIISTGHKEVGSREGHGTALSSDYQAARVAGATDRLERCKAALFERDFGRFAAVVEQDSNMMHAVMMTSQPPLFYWQPASLVVMDAVRRWRSEGLSVCYTLDAGPNVHCLTTAQDADEIERRVTALSGVQRVLRAPVGGGAVVLG
jgi:diphosphomevalonate decarboxylase